MLPSPATTVANQFAALVPSLGEHGSNAPLGGAKRAADGSPSASSAASVAPPQRQRLPPWWTRTAPLACAIFAAAAPAVQADGGEAMLPPQA